MATGGSIVGFTHNGNNYSIPNDVFPTLKHAGSMNESIDHGDGTAHPKKTATSWKATGLVVNVDAAGWRQLQDDAESCGVSSNRHNAGIGGGLPGKRYDRGRPELRD